MGLDSLLTLQRNDLLRPLMDWVCITRGAGGGGGGGGGGRRRELHVVQKPPVGGNQRSWGGEEEEGGRRRRRRRPKEKEEIQNKLSCMRFKAASKRWRRMERKERERVLGEEVRHGKEET